MVVPFKLVRDPFNKDKLLPVYAGDGQDVIFRNSKTLQNDKVAFGETDNMGSGEFWGNNKWSTRTDRDDSDVTLLNPLKRGEYGDDNRTSAKKKLRNW